MDIILGGTGHVGSEVAKNLLADGRMITVVTRDSEKKQDWNNRGAEVVVVDIHETETLAKIFKNGQTLFFLNPPADRSLDTVKEEKMTVYSILKALKNSGIKKVVAESTYGSQPGDGLGDLGVLHEMELGLKELEIPSSIIRAANHMSNWDHLFETAKSEGQIYSFYPLDFKLPMVAPADIGKFASQLMEEPVCSTGIFYIEGPERYSVRDVAVELTEMLRKNITVKIVGPGAWAPWLMHRGYSQAAAESVVKMTEAKLEEVYPMPTNPTRGSTSLRKYVQNLGHKSLNQ